MRGDDDFGGGGETAHVENKNSNPSRALYLLKNVNDARATSVDCTGDRERRLLRSITAPYYAPIRSITVYS